MAANVFRFEEDWEIPGASVEDVYDVLSRGELLPLWWKGVYLEAQRLDHAAFGRNCPNAVDVIDTHSQERAPREKPVPTFSQRAPDGEGPPKVGDRIRAEARGFLPYRLRFVLEAVELAPARRVVVKASGDFDGRWTAMLSPKEGGAQSGVQSGVHVGLVWEVRVERPILKFLAPLLRPAFAWNHRWTTPRGEKGLREYLAQKRTLDASGA